MTGCWMPRRCVRRVVSATFSFRFRSERYGEGRIDGSDPVGSEVYRALQGRHAGAESNHRELGARHGVIEALYRSDVQPALNLQRA